MRSIGPRWNDERGCFGCVLNASARVDALRRRRRRLFVRHAIPKAIWDGVTDAKASGDQGGLPLLPPRGRRRGGEFGVELDRGGR